MSFDKIIVNLKDFSVRVFPKCRLIIPLFDCYFHAENEDLAMQGLKETAKGTILLNFEAVRQCRL